MLGMFSERCQDRSQIKEPEVENGPKHSCHRTDPGRQKDGETEHGIDMQPGARCLFVRLHLKVNSSKSCPQSASFPRQRLGLLHSFATGSQSNCLDGKFLSAVERQRTSLRCGKYQTHSLLSLLLPVSVENITNQLLSLSHWAWTELQTLQHSLPRSQYQSIQDGS